MRRAIEILKERVRNAIESRMVPDYFVERKSSYEGLFVNFEQWMLLRHRETDLVYHLEVDGERVRVFRTDGPTSNLLLATLELSHRAMQVPNVEAFVTEVYEYITRHHERELEPATHYLESQQ
jgi:hypothetical protein